MPTQNVSDLLAPHGLVAPDLEVLRASERSYTALLLQPSGPVFADANRIGPQDMATAHTKGLAFLRLAQSRGAHLAVAPEYFMPWTVLREAIDGNETPGNESLWVLGCESASEADVEAFKAYVAGRCLVLHEPWQGLATDRTLLDPVVLVFWAKRTGGSDQLVAIVQFKTYPSRDNTFFEERLLRRGTLIYKFQGEGHLCLAVIICSDAFALDDEWLRDFYDRSTLIHIQLNPDPRNVHYRRYRATTFGIDERASSCHIVCLNWARNVELHSPGAATERWNNIAGSIIYCPERDCSSNDALVVPNHSQGVYYAHMKERRHALVLHYDEAAFELSVPKLLIHGTAAMANRNGPSAVRRYEWDVTNATWIHREAAPNSGFEDFVGEYPEIRRALEPIVGLGDPLAIERALALTAGAVTGTNEWHSLPNIDSCQMDTDEVVFRLTVAQDRAGDAFRYARLSVAAQVQHQLATATYWPPQVGGTDAGSTLNWRSTNPNFNVETRGGDPTLIVYLGENPLPPYVEGTADKLYELLRKGGGEHQTRLCIFFRDIGGQAKYASIPGLTRYDDALGDMTDLTSVKPLSVEGDDNA